MNTFRTFGELAAKIVARIPEPDVFSRVGKNSPPHPSPLAGEKAPDEPRVPNTPRTEEEEFA